MLKIETNEIVLRIIIFICQYLKIKEIKVSIWFNKTCTDYPKKKKIYQVQFLFVIFHLLLVFWSKDEILILHFFNYNLSSTWNTRKN